MPSVDDLEWKFLPHWVHCCHTNHSLRPEIKYRKINFLSKGQDFIVTFFLLFVWVFDVNGKVYWVFEDDGVVYWVFDDNGVVC